MTINYHEIITIEQEVLDDYDYLTQDDIRACFAYAADRERHSRVIAG